MLATLGRAGFSIARTKGSHVRLRHPDGRAVTVPVHAATCG
ncbi:MAG TPA: type II toxin-antitoxin system HicA family toxin [bacterium]|nr:type II toxin-antitoxin system HicA family toxin [bacterium]